MIALKTDPIWPAINAFGLPCPPFNLDSAFDVRDISFTETQKLGILNSAHDTEAEILIDLDQQKFKTALTAQFELWQQREEARFLRG